MTRLFYDFAPFSHSDGFAIPTKKVVIKSDFKIQKFKHRAALTLQLGKRKSPDTTVWQKKKPRRHSSAKEKAPTLNRRGDVSQIRILFFIYLFLSDFAFFISFFIYFLILLCLFRILICNLTAYLPQKGCQNGSNNQGWQGQS